MEELGTLKNPWLAQTQLVFLATLLLCLLFTRVEGLGRVCWRPWAIPPRAALGGPNPFIMFDLDPLLATKVTWSSKSRKCKALCGQEPGKSGARGEKHGRNGKPGSYRSPSQGMDTSSVTNSAARRPGNQPAKARAQFYTPLSRESGHGRGPEPATRELGPSACLYCARPVEAGANLCIPAWWWLRSSRPFRSAFRRLVSSHHVPPGRSSHAARPFPQLPVGSCCKMLWGALRFTAASPRLEPGAAPPSALSAQRRPGGDWEDSCAPPGPARPGVETGACEGEAGAGGPAEAEKAWKRRRGQLRGDDGRPEPQQLGGRSGRLPAASATLAFDPSPCPKKTPGGQLLAMPAVSVDGKGPKEGLPMGYAAAPEIQWGDHDVEERRRPPWQRRPPPPPPAPPSTSTPPPPSSVVQPLRQQPWLSLLPTGTPDPSLSASPSSFVSGPGLPLPGVPASPPSLPPRFGVGGPAPEQPWLLVLQL